MAQTKNTNFPLDGDAVLRLRRALDKYHEQLAGGAIGAKNIGGRSAEEADLLDELFKHATPLTELAEESI